MRVRLVEVREADAPQKKSVCAYARVSSDSSHQEDSLENRRNKRLSAHVE